MTETAIVKIADGDVEAIQLAEPLDYWLTFTREAIIDLTSGSVCVTTLAASGDCQASTAQRLSAKQVEQIETELAACIPKLPTQPAGVSLHINEIERRRYETDPHGGAFAETISTPVVMKGALTGFLVLSNFNKDNKLADGELFVKLQAELPAINLNLWRLNHDECEKFRVLATSVIDGIILCNRERQIQFINRAALEILSVEKSQNLLGQPLKSLAVAYLTEFLEEALNNGLHEINKVVQPPNKKSQLIGVHTELLKTARNREIGWMIALRDVTTTWQNDQMRSALSIASHEIKTPLSSITGTLDTLLERDLGDLNDQQERCLEIIKDDIDGLNRLITDILDLSRFEEGVKFLDRRKQISLDFLLNKVIYSFRSYARTKNILIENKTPKTIPTFRGDRDRLQQVISNLIENGIKYSLPNSKIEIHADLKNNILSFWIKDSGVGIPEDAYELIFEKFQQLDNYPDHAERGYGLGLSIAREIVKAAGGKIWVESQVGVGSTFYVTIPV